MILSFKRKIKKKRIFFLRIIMPKTKLGSEIKNYGYKKLRTNQCRLSSSLENEELKKTLKNILQKDDTEAASDTKELIENIKVITNPFKCVVVENFITNQEFLTELKLECEYLKFNQKNNDLYKFKQSPALTNNSGNQIHKLRMKLLEQMRPWIQELLHLELESENLDLFCAMYRHSDTLLCHDDQLEGRKVAFILYLTDDDWAEADGGQLELFNTDEEGNPGSVVRRLMPVNNSFAFFEVSPQSYHQVAEVLSESKTRMSLSGWFLGSYSPSSSPRQPPPPSPYLATVELEEDKFFSWINPSYLNPETQVDIQSQFENSSEISLSEFLQPELYNDLCLALASHESWTRMGPPDRRCLDVLDDHDEVDEVIKSCLQFFTSDAFYLMLSNLTGLKLHQLAPESDNEEEEQEDKAEKVYNPRCRGGYSRWSRGCYTLIRDDDQEQAEYALDLRMFFNVTGYEEDSEAGGQTVYLARDEDEELVTVMPEENTLSLVYRDKDSLKFIKYVNSRLEQSFQDLSLTYYE